MATHSRLGDGIRPVAARVAPPRVQLHHVQLIQGLQFACVMTIAAFTPQVSAQAPADTLLPCFCDNPTNAGPLSCAEILAKQTVVVFPGPEVPWLGDIGNLMPTHTINTTSGAVGLIPLSDPSIAACAQSITDIVDTLVIFEDGNLTFHLDQLPRNIIRTRPRGQLIIRGKVGRNKTGLTNLNFLQGLQSVGGLSVYNMDGLNTLQGLGGLTSITGDFIVSENDNLYNLTGVDSLTSITGDFIMNSNMNIKTLDGLGKLQSIGGQFLLKGNGYLMNVDALSSLKTVGTTVSFPNNGNVQMKLAPGVRVGPNATLSAEYDYDADGGSVGGGLLVIYGGTTPPALDAVLNACDMFMPPMTKFDLSAQSTKFHPASQPVPTTASGVVTGNVLIYDDGQIQSLVPSLGTVRGVTGSVIVAGGLSIGMSEDGPMAPGLKTLDGMQNIQAVGELGILSSTQLRDLTGLSSLTNITHNLVVMFSASMTSLTGINLTLIGSEIWLEGNPMLLTLSGLENLIDVGWKLSIRDCMSLSSLDGLRSLRRVKGGIVILDNYNLSSLAGLSSLESAGSVSLMWNKNLTDIIGLSRLTRLPGDLVLAGNPILSLAPLQNLRSTGFGVIIARTNITDLTGLNALESVGGGLSITGNGQFRSLQGLKSLKEVGDDVSIRANPQLNNLSPLDWMLKTVGGGVYIEDNWSLSSLGQLPYDINGIGGVVVVRRNGVISSSQISSLSSKAYRYSGVPDTVMLLPRLKQVAIQQAYPTKEPGPVMVAPSNGTSAAGPLGGGAPTASSAPMPAYAMQGGGGVVTLVNPPGASVTAFG